MKKKITAIIFVCVLCLFATIPTFAAEDDGFAADHSRLNDAADILSKSEETELLKKLDEISIRQKADVVVVTVDDIENSDSVQDYADDCYDYWNYGYGADKDGVLLLISMKDRDWYISTCGYGITAFTDAGIQYIGKQMKPDLSDGNYAAAFDTYAKLCDEFITQARSGKPYDKSNLPREPLSMIWIPISIAIGVVLALIVVSTMKSKLKTVRSQAAANSYVKNGSLNITNSSEMFLYNTVTRSARAKDTSSGGSSTHTSSSGTTHGGGGGKF